MLFGFANDSYMKEPSKNELKYDGIITTGDWSQDGHNRYNIFRYKATHSIVEQQNAYIKSVNDIGLSFNHQLAQGIDCICTRWKNNFINPYHMSIFKKYTNIENTKFGNNGPCGFAINEYDNGSFHEEDISHFAEFILWFISLSIPDFKYTKLKTTLHYNYERDVELLSRNKEISNILNGWWNKKLNVQFGYGCYDTYQTTNFKIKQIPNDRKIIYLTNKNSYFGYWLDETPYEYRFNKNELRKFSVGNIFDHYKNLIKNNELEGLVMFTDNRIFFENKNDALLFKLSF